MSSKLGLPLRFFRRRIGRVVLLASVLHISGCLVLSVSYKQNQAFSKHVARADEMERQERLADALDQWRIATAINPESIEANQRAQALEGQIAARVSELTAKADLAASKGSHKESTRLLLSALSLQPDDRTLFRRIAAFERDEARTRVAASPSRTNSSRADPSSYRESDSPDGAPAAPLRAEAKFQSAVEVFATDKPRANQLFLEALELDPTHLGARAYLQILSKKKQ